MSGFPKRGRRVAGPAAHGSSSFIALGASASSNTSVGSSFAPKRPADASSEDRKRDYVSTFSTSTSSSCEWISDPKSAKVQDQDVSKLAMQILSCVEAEDTPSLVSKLSEAIKYISISRVSPNEALCGAVLTAFKALQESNILESYPKLLKLVSDILKDSSWSAGSGTAKQRPCNLAVALSCNILYLSYRSSKDVWPIQFVKLFIEDFIQERIWSDLNSQLTNDFVMNLISSYRTELVSGFAESMSSSFQKSRLYVSGANTSATLKDESKISPIGSPVPFQMTSSDDSKQRVDRYPGDQSKSLLSRFVIDACTEVFGRTKQGPSTSLSLVQLDLQQKNILQLLSITCGLPSVRSFAAQKLEIWLHNTKLLRPAQDLLSAVCLNCTSDFAVNEDASENEEIISSLVRIKPKNKMVGNLVTLCLKEMAGKNVQVHKILVRSIVYNEFSGSARNPNNMILITQLFIANSLLLTTHLAYAFQLVLYHKEDFTKAVRTFFRDIVKHQKSEIKFDQFCAQLLDIQPEVKKKMDSENLILSKYLISIAELAVYALYICLPMNSRERYASRLKKEEKDCWGVIAETQKSVVEIIAHFIEWIKAHSPYFTGELYSTLLQKMLLFDPVEVCLRQDPFPPDQSICHRLLIESGVLESSLFSIINMGLDANVPLNSQSTMNIIEGLVTRSPLGAISIKNADEFVEQLFKVAVYTKPVSISLPANYSEPKLAVSKLLWKAWTVLLVLCGSNLDTVGKLGWEKLPMLKMLMEMCLTSDFNYPPSASSVNRDDLRRQELRIAEQERNEIISFECHLAGKLITSESSLLIPQLMFMDPWGPTRQPNPEYLTHLKLICNSWKVGNALCSSRSNDYLLDILKRNRTLGSSGSSWLSQIIMTSDLANLPPQCLCEFVLTDSKTGERSEKAAAVRNCLKDSIVDSKLDLGGDYACKVFAYLLTALASSEDISKKHAAAELILELFSSVSESYIKHDNLFDSVFKLPCVKQHFGKEMMNVAIQTLAKEFDCALVASALKFIVAQIATQNIESISFLTSFADVFSSRYSVIEASLGYCTDLSSIFPSCCRIIFTLFRQDNSSDPNSKDLVLGRGTNFNAPSSVITCLYCMLFLSSNPNDNVDTFPLKDLSFEVVNTILPEWAIISCALNCKLLFAKWVEQMINISHLVKVLSYIGLDESLQNLVVQKVENYSLNGIKEALKDLDTRELQHDLVSKFGPKLECAYASVVQTSLQNVRNQKAIEIVEEIDELDVDVHDDPMDAPLSIRDCKNVDALAMLIAQVISKHPGQSLTLVQISNNCIDYSDLSEAFCQALQVEDLVSSMCENISVHEFTAFVLQVGNSLSFRGLNKLYSQCEETLKNTKFHRSLKIIKIHLQNEESNMQPISPEPEVRLSLKSHSLIEQAQPKTGTMSGKEFSCNGKVLDLVQISDPETVRKNADYLWKILFSANHNFSAYHCFLLANLVHKSTWNSLQSTVKSLLDGLDTVEASLNPTVVLDFLTAIQTQPKLFQGRETHQLLKVPSHVIRLDIAVVSKLLVLTYQECSDSMKSDKNYLDLLQSRIMLLLKLLNKKENVSDLISLCATFNNERIKKSIQMLLYLNTAVPVPDLKEKLPSVKTDKFHNSFSMDLLTYNLILPLDASNKLDFDSNQLVSSLIFKFASLHPVFVNRQLELISVLLKGRFRSSWTSFRRDGHAELFRGCVRVLLRLAPGAFAHKKFPEVLQTILETVKSFAALTNEMYRKLRTDIFELIDLYFEYDHAAARKILMPYTSYLTETPKRNKYLLNCIGELDMDSNVFPQTSSQQSVSASDLNKCRKFFSGSIYLDSASEEILSHLKIVEELSHKQEQHVESMVEPILSLLHSSCSDVVERAMTVLMSICKSCPSVSDAIASELIELLGNGAMFSASSSLHSILNLYTVDLLVVNCSDRGIRLLTAMFDACVFTTFPEADAQLKKVMSSTTLQKIFAQINS